MPEGTSVSLVNLDGLAKPADTFIKKVSEAVGGVFAPFQVVRMAKAETEAALIKAHGETEVAELRRRAMHRFVEEETQKQHNIEDITAKALPHLSAAANPGAMERDWITNFFDKSRIITDQDMQALWARVLAGEANVPGTFSKRTVNLLGDLDKTDAELFTKLCGFAWNFGDLLPLVFDVHAEIYTRQGLTFTSLSHLDSIGLIQFDNLGGFCQIASPNGQSTAPIRFDSSYHGQGLTLQFYKEKEWKIGTGKVFFTKTGQELAAICTKQPVDGFWEYVLEKWKDDLLKSVPPPFTPVPRC